VQVVAELYVFALQRVLLVSSASALKSRSGMPVVRIGILEIVVPAGMLKVTVLFALHGAGVVSPDGQTLMLPKFTACAKAAGVAETNATNQTRATRARLVLKQGEETMLKAFEFGMIGAPEDQKSSVWHGESGGFLGEKDSSRG
jgi:hypothetical protein